MYRIVYASSANTGLTSLEQQGFFSAAQIGEVRAEISEWVRTSYQGWRDNEHYSRTLELRHPVRVIAKKQPQGNEELVTIIRVDGS
jgi:hypothetical protein